MARNENGERRTGSSEVRQALQACRGHFMSAGLFSFAINLLFLTYPLYMMQVYDRVLSSGSVTTLVMLTIAALLAFAVMGALEVIRSRIFVRAGVRLETRLYDRVLAALVDRGNRSGTARSQALRDLDGFRQVIASNAVNAVFDTPWVPIYLVVLFALHPLIGFVGLLGAGMLLVLTAANQLAMRRPLEASNAAMLRGYANVDAALRNSEIVQALGMLPGLERRWSGERQGVLHNQVVANDRAALFAGITKSSRLVLQMFVLGVGSYLVIQEAISPGAMFAGLILLGRAVAPVDQLIASWKQLVSARQSYRRVAELLQSCPPPADKMSLPRPTGRIEVERAAYVPPGCDKPVIKGIGFAVAPGEAVAIVGPSAAGKSTLARLLVGVVRPSSGAVRLDGAEICDRDRAELGKHIGYLPQDIELFAGTVRDNIARFCDADSEAVIRAAELAGVHDMILRLPAGYDTEIGEGGVALSGGQRQRLGLARALFGDPQFVVLDEPNASLDGEGEAALVRALVSLKAAGTTVIVIAHRPSMLRTVDKLLVLKDGMIELFGPRDEILAKTTRGFVRPVAAAAPGQTDTAQTPDEPQAVGRPS